MKISEFEIKNLIINDTFKKYNNFRVWRFELK